ncbi:alpha-L-rhamnosidase C-terminal domain-containing protein [Cohnella sp.]|uniref:alpha-L-rhamnosidase C-terminal domain-containing protein n=1 Tax=Cohnella sp. TaxID=1883426 RepID=UPI0037042C36
MLGDVSELCRESGQSRNADAQPLPCLVGCPRLFSRSVRSGNSSFSSGWEEIVVEPQPVDLLWARGSVPHPAGGRIDVSWRIVAECEMQVRVWTPAGVRANVRLPEGFRGTIERAEF